jgi:ABC-2 type transport system permease protein
MKLARDTWLIFHRQMLLMARTPVWIAIGLIQPLVYLLLFAPLLKMALGAQTYAQAYQVYIPGLLTALVLFGGLFSGFTLLAELRAGVVERFRVTPVSRLALLLGRALRETVVLIVQAILITILALPFGLTVGLGGVLLAYVLLAMMALAASSLSYGITLVIRGDAALAPVVNTISQPLALLSGTLLPIALAPHWLRATADGNPFFWAVQGLRSMFAGQLGAPAVWESLVIVAALVVVSVGWSARLFKTRVQ